MNGINLGRQKHFTGVKQRCRWQLWTLMHSPKIKSKKRSISHFDHAIHYHGRHQDSSWLDSTSLNPVHCCFLELVKLKNGYEQEVRSDELYRDELSSDELSQRRFQTRESQRGFSEKTDLELHLMLLSTTKLTVYEQVMSTLALESDGMAMGTPASRLALQSAASDLEEWSMLRGTSLTAEMK